MILGIETSCDETAAAVITPDGQVLSSIVASQAELHAHYGGVVPEVASRRHLELIAPVLRAALDEAQIELGDLTPDRGHARAGADRCAARRALGRQGDRVVARDPARAGRPPPGSRRVALPRGVTRRATLRLPPRERGAHAAPGRARARLVRAARHDARRRRGGGVRQGRAPARPAVPGRGRDRRARPPRRSRGVPVPDRPRARPRLLVLGRQDVAALRRSRPRRQGFGSALDDRRADLAASYQRAIVLALTQRLREAAEHTGIERIAVVGGVAANSELRAALPDAALVPLALCTDNAAMIASAARFADPLPAAEARIVDAYASAA